MLHIWVIRTAVYPVFEFTRLKEYMKRRLKGVIKEDESRDKIARPRVDPVDLRGNIPIWTSIGIPAWMPCLSGCQAPNCHRFGLTSGAPVHSPLGLHESQALLQQGSSFPPPGKGYQFACVALPADPKPSGLDLRHHVGHHDELRPYLRSHIAPLAVCQEPKTPLPTGMSRGENHKGTLGALKGIDTPEGDFKVIEIANEITQNLAFLVVITWKTEQVYLSEPESGLFRVAR
ncbi:unnamed protein product [Penicillium bialowiezense]